MFDFKKSKKCTRSLHNKIIKIYNSDIKIVEGPMDMGANETLIARIINGIPTIIVKEGTVLHEEGVYHEMFHLYLKGKTHYHEFEIENPLKNKLNSQFHQPMVVLGKFHSILQHSFFFNKMIKQGFSPSKCLLEAFNDQLNSYPECYPKDTYHHIIMDIWNFLLGKNDSKIDQQGVLLFLEEFNEEYLIATKIVEYLENFKNPNDEPDYFCGAFEILTNIGEIKVEYKSNDPYCVFYS